MLVGEVDGYWRVENLSWDMEKLRGVVEVEVVSLYEIWRLERISTRGRVGRKRRAD